MTISELIKALQEKIEKSPNVDENTEVGIAFNDGWTSITSLESDTPRRGVVLIQTDDVLYDQAPTET